jgi:hypothetical protein
VTGRAALGFSVHTGWAALAVLGGTPRAPEVVDRREVEMIPGHEPDAPPFVFHAARGLPLPKAEVFIRQFAERSEEQARRALQVVVKALKSSGRRAEACAFTTAKRPVTAGLAGILRNHSLIHAAEGELFRAAIHRAGEAIGLGVTRIPSTLLRPRAAAAVGIPEGALDDWLGELGRAAGKPWAKDQKEACLAAAVALWTPGSDPL